MSTTQTIPKEHKAAVKEGNGSDASTSIQTVATPTPGLGQILVKVNYTGLCSSDKSLIYVSLKLQLQPYNVSDQLSDLTGCPG